jgi:hypothetical protein
MSKQAFSKLWSFFAFSSLTLPFLFFLKTTGANPNGDAFGILGYKATTIAILALPMDIALAAITLWLTLAWTKSIRGLTWAHRFPIFYFEEKDVDPSSHGGKLYQRWSFALVLVVPILLMTQMANRFFNASVYASGKKLVQGWEHFNWAVLANASPQMLRFGESDGPEYFIVQPWIYSVLLAALLWLWLVTMRAIVRS